MKDNKVVQEMTETHLLARVTGIERSGTVTRVSLKG